jgi:hypothetical protein
MHSLQSIKSARLATDTSGTLIKWCWPNYGECSNVDSVINDVPRLKVGGKRLKCPCLILNGWISHAISCVYNDYTSVYTAEKT